MSGKTEMFKSTLVLGWILFGLTLTSSLCYAEQPHSYIVDREEIKRVYNNVAAEDPKLAEDILRELKSSIATGEIEIINKAGMNTDQSYHQAIEDLHQDTEYVENRLESVENQLESLDFKQDPLVDERIEEMTEESIALEESIASKQPPETPLDSQKQLAAPPELPDDTVVGSTLAPPPPTDPSKPPEYNPEQPETTAESPVTDVAGADDDTQQVDAPGDTTETVQAAESPAPEPGPPINSNKGFGE